MTLLASTSFMLLVSAADNIPAQPTWLGWHRAGAELHNDASQG